MVSRDADSWLLDWLLMDKGDLSRKKEGQGVLAEGMKEQRPSIGKDSHYSVGGWCGYAQSKLRCTVVGWSKASPRCMLFATHHDTLCHTVP